MSKATMTALPYPTIFVPKSITGCTLWLDGQDPAGTGTAPSSGSTITTWADKSGVGNTATAYGTVTISPLVNGKLAMSTTSSSGFFGYLTNTNTTATTFVVATYVTPNAYNRLFAVSTGTLTDYNNPGVALFACAINGSSMGAYYNSPSVTALCPGAITQNQPFIMTTAFTGTQCIINLNGTPTSASPTNQATSFSYTYYGIGTHAVGYGSVGECWTGTIAEVLHYTTALTTPQIQQVEGYLAWKWGLQASLAGSHPYAAAAPMITNSLGFSRAPAVTALVPTPTKATTAVSYYTTVNPLTAASGCELWLDASDATTTTVVTGKLTAWTDKSGKNRSVTVPTNVVTYKSAFLNGLATLGFAGNANITTSIATPPGNGDYALIAVWKPYSGGTYSAVTVGPSSSSPSAGIGYNGAYYNIYEWGQAESDYTTAHGSYVIQIGTRIGGIKTCYINGLAAPTGTGTLQNITNGAVSIGGGNGFYTTGEIAEVIVYSGTLSTSQRQQLEGWLAWKWGLQASLPVFVPTSVGGTQLWLDGADASTKTFTGANLTVWNDKSGNGYNMNTLTATAVWTGSAEYPINGTTINGLQTVKFTAQAGLKQSTQLDGVKNLFWLGRIAAPVGSGGGDGFFLLGNDVGYDWHGYPYGDKFLHTGAANSGIINASPASLFTSDVNAITNATFSSVYKPSAPNVSLLSVAGITGTTRYQGICYDRANHIGWCGDLAEVIVYSTALTTPQRQQVEGYLVWKWGLQATLPTDHPYYSVNPNHPYLSAAPIGASKRPAAVTALVPKGLLSITSITSYISLRYTGSTESYFAKYTSDGSIKSVACQNGSGADVGNGIAIDTNGNTIITGYYTSNPFTFYSSSGSAFPTTLVNSGQTAFVAQYSPTGNVNWVAKFSGSSVGLFCKTDSSNNIYVFGYFTSAPLTAYSSSGTAFGTTISTLYYFLVKYNSSGTVQWIANIGGTGQTNQNSFTCDPTGNAIVTCTGGGLTPLNSDGSSYTGSGILGAYRVNGFIIYYNSSGFIQWVASFAGGSRFWNQAISVDSSGNVYCSGYSLGGFAQIYNASGTGGITIAGVGGQNGYIAKYTSTGTNLSGSAYGGSGVTAAPLSQVTDSNANTTIVGTFTGTTFIAYSSNSTSLPFSNTLSNPGTTCGFIVQYNSSFVVQWTANIQAATGAATPTGITCDSSNNYYVSVYCTGTVTVYNSNGLAATTIKNSGTNTSFILKFSSAGLLIWAARQSGGTSTSHYLYGIATDSTGNPYAVGAYTTATGLVYTAGF